MNRKLEEIDQAITEAISTQKDVATIFSNTLREYIEVKSYFDHITSTIPMNYALHKKLSGIMATIKISSGGITKDRAVFFDKCDECCDNITEWSKHPEPSLPLVLKHKDAAVLKLQDLCDHFKVLYGTSGDSFIFRCGELLDMLKNTHNNYVNRTSTT